MATWVRNGTGTAPTSTDANLTGRYSLDNGTAPGDFDGANVTSVQIAYTITGTSFGASSDTWDDLRAATLDDGTNTAATVNGTDNTGLANTSSNTSETDSSPNTGLSNAQWEAMAVSGGTTINSNYTTWNQDKGKDGGVQTMSALVVTITYDPVTSVDLAGTVVSVGDVDAGSDQLHRPVGTVEAVASNTAALTVTAATTVQVTEDGRLVFSGAVAEGGDIPISRIRLVGTVQSDTALNGGDVTLTFDGSPQEGDVNFLVGGIGTTDAGDTVGPSTAGYTQLAFEDWTADENLAFGVWYKEMGATPDTDVVGQGSGEAQDSTGYVSYMFRGVDTSNISDAAAVLSSGTGTNPDLSAITTVTDKAIVFAAYAHVGAGDITAPPSGYRNLTEAKTADTNRSNIGAAFKEVGSAGSENPGAFTDSSANAWKGYTFAIRPAVNAFVTEDGAIIFPNLEVSAPAAGTTDLTGTINGVGSATANLKQLQRSAATVPAVADHDVASKQVHRSSATIPAVGSVAAGSHQLHTLDATVASVADHDFGSKQTHKPAATITGVASATGSIASPTNLAGTISAVGSNTADLKQLHRSAATIPAVASASGDLKEFERPTGTITAVGSNTADLTQLHRSAATVPAVGENTVASKQVHKPAGTISAVASNTANIGGGNNLSATVQAVGDIDAGSKQVQRLGAATVVGISDLNVSAKQLQQSSATVPAVGSLNAGSHQVHTADSTVQAVATNTAAITVVATADLAATVQAVATNTAALTLLRNVAATIESVGSGSGSPAQTQKLVSTIQAIATVVGTASQITPASETTFGFNGVSDTLVGTLGLADALVGGVGAGDSQVGSMGVDELTGVGAAGSGFDSGFDDGFG